MGAYAILLILYISLTYYIVEGLRKNILYGDDIHTKSKVFSDAMGVSSYVECVDIYKQPSFENPLLKNHKIQMEPSFQKERGRGRALEYDINKTTGYIQEKSCPNGLVPIQRRKGGVIKPLRLDDPGFYNNAVLESVGTIYRGASASMQINQPLVEPDQYSGSFVWLAENETIYKIEIAVGLMVNPKLYGDNKVRLTAFWDSKSDRDAGCYNTLCPGFVQINQNLHLGVIFPNVSSEQKQFEVKLSIGQDIISGNWWLVYGFQNIGYWPKEGFGELFNGVSFVRFGGVTHTPSFHSNPPMGRGTFATYDSATSSTFRRIQIIDENYRVFDIDYSKTQLYSDYTNKCYSIHLWKYDPSNGAVISYGGPGGDCGA